ncbi:MAG: phosphatase PAP2 family protein [Dehalococcoidia bacterium]|nr:phosphatase PAP2 family protein [Dehalococcoidia bacterium]
MTSVARVRDAGHPRRDATPVPSSHRILSRVSHLGWRLLAAGFAAVLVVFVVDALVRERGGFDYAALRSVQRMDAPGLEQLFRFASALTGSFWAVTLWAVLLGALIAARRWIDVTVMFAFPATGAVNSVIRELVGRSRPFDTTELTRVADANDWVSFPSGHVVGAVLLWGFVFVLARELRWRPVRWAVKGFAVGVIVLSGPARLWLGAHWVSDVAAGYAVGGLALTLVLAWYRAMGPEAHGIPLVRAAAVPHDDALPHAHALTSTILFRQGKVLKIYNPGYIPRLIYFAAFQAPFGYAASRTALEAAVLRRNLAGKLTEYWYGSNRVAYALGPAEVDGRLAIVSRYTDGREPTDHARAHAFLAGLADHFDEAGLPTWQVDPRQPRALGNILETPSGEYTIIDLESGLVSPLASPRAWRRAFRRGLVPIYDDVYFDTTRAYLQRESGVIRAAMGGAWLRELEDLLDAAEAKVNAWHASEPRIWSRLVRGAWCGFGIPSVPRRLRARGEAGREHADIWIEHAIAAWEADGRVSADEGSALRGQLLHPDVQAVLPHFGVHLAIGIALRFPFGAITRVTYTTTNLMVACARFGLRRTDRTAFHRSLRIHSPLVIMVAALPGFGTFSYLASGPVRSNRLLARVILDAVALKLPWHVYRRSGLQRIISRKPGSDVPGATDAAPGPA